MRYSVLRYWAMHWALMVLRYRYFHEECSIKYSVFGIKKIFFYKCERPALLLLSAFKMLWKAIKWLNSCKCLENACKSVVFGIRYKISLSVVPKYRILKVGEKNTTVQNIARFLPTLPTFAELYSTAQ